MLSEKEKKKLFELAYTSIKKERCDLSDVPKKLKEYCGVFVTLTKDGELRGCIGYIEPIMPIYQAVIECAHSAAYKDIRFLPVEKDEINSLKVEISILSQPEKLVYESPEDLLNKLNRNMGVILQKGFRKATFLPQVWDELPDKIEFLSHLCMKAGLSSEYWRTDNPDIQIYTVERFTESIKS